MLFISYNLEIKTYLPTMVISLTANWIRWCMQVYAVNAKRQAKKRKPPIFYIFGVMQSWIEPRPPAPHADALTTMLCPVLNGLGLIN